MKMPKNILEINTKAMLTGRRGEVLRMRLVYEGWVQGIGFRWSNRRIAQQLSLSGWVKNRSDGSVELEIQGPAEKIVAHLSNIRDVYRNSHYDIRLAEADELPVKDGESGFSVLFS